MRRRYSTNRCDDGVSGILLVDKPAGWTSHDVVAFIRGFGFRKVGHCGTLDPAATGLLVLLIGKATKLTNQFNSREKEYDATLCLGSETTTHDADGDVVRTGEWSHISEHRIRRVFSEFVGVVKQVPPMVSAKKVGGRRLYKLARKGIVVHREPVDIRVDTLEIQAINLPYVTFVIECSKGTYVRTICHDIGRRLGCGGHLFQLARIRSGDFLLEDAYSMDDIRNWNREILICNCILPDSVAARP